MSKPILEANAVVPLYRQLMEKLQKEITSGILKPGDRLHPRSRNGEILPGQRHHRTKSDG